MRVKFSFLILLMLLCCEGQRSTPKSTKDAAKGDAFTLSEKESTVSPIECVPLGEPGSKRKCPTECELIYAKIIDMQSHCSRGRIIAGCFSHGPQRRSGEIRCYMTADISVVAVTDAIYPELVEQDWESCTDEISQVALDSRSECK